MRDERQEANYERYKDRHYYTSRLPPTLHYRSTYIVHSYSKMGYPLLSSRSTKHSPNTLPNTHHTDGEIMELERVAREAVLRHMLEPAVLAGK